MNILLVAINAKYIHSNLAVMSIYRYGLRHCYKTDNLLVKEYTINHEMDKVLMDIYSNRPRAVFFSCYIWNIEYINDIARELKKLLPDLIIWYGGPEVSYDGMDIFNKYPYLTGIMVGEGEKTFSQLYDFYENNLGQLQDIEGIIYRINDNIVENKPQSLMNMDELEFVYDDFDIYKNRIIYYESSRGCPFRCSYCMSSIDKQVRFRSLDLVFKELKVFLDNKVLQVKFIDRTFNIDKDRTVKLLSFIRDNDNGITNFHFEVAADIMTEKQLEVINSMRPGLIQLEIGVQTTNRDTLRQIRRRMDYDRLRYVVDRIRASKNVHIHLDLIAGLPYEDKVSFKKSFNDVYSMKPHELQLGFLKVLKGAYMHEMAPRYGLIYNTKAPYEVLRTNWIEYEDIISLKAIEDMVEVYYNSGLFDYTLEYLIQFFDSGYDMYDSLASYYAEHGYDGIKHSRITRYNILKSFIDTYCGGKAHICTQLLILDLYIHENLKTRPEFAMPLEAYKEHTRLLYKEYSSDYKGVDFHIEPFDIDVEALLTEKTIVEETCFVLFDYSQKDVITRHANLIYVK